MEKPGKSNFKPFAFIYNLNQAHGEARKGRNIEEKERQRERERRGEKMERGVGMKAGKVY